MTVHTQSIGLFVVSPKEVKSWIEKNAAQKEMPYPTFKRVSIFPGFEDVCKLIGHGANGTVYKAVDPHTYDVVAVKKLDLQKPGAQAFAYKERQMMQACGPHPNICRLRSAAYGPDEKSMVLVMDYADADMRVVRDSRIVLPEAALRCFATQLLKGVQHMHSKNIVHRDIKPANVLLTHNGIVQLTDFGFAETMRRGMWLQNSPESVVTLNYRPPELLLGSTEPHG